MVPHRSRLKVTKASESIFDGRVAQLVEQPAQKVDPVTD